MLAVSNTSPISNLASIGWLELLRSQLSVVWIPTGVGVELGAHPNPAAAEAIKSAQRDEWIRTASPADSPLLRILLLDLDQGEAEAIALAVEMKADTVLLDETEGRKLAAECGLSVTGVLGILLRAKHSGEIKAIRPEIQLLRDRPGSL